MLESKGFNIVIENGTLKVLFGAWVVMKATRQIKLYFLKGSIVVGGANTVVDKLEEVASDTTRLWHMHLGHVGENALQRLMKQGLLKGAKTCKLEFCEHCVLGSKLESSLA